MKKILTLGLLFFILKINAQPAPAVTAVSCGAKTYYIRTAILQVYVPAHAVSTTTCPDGSLHDDTEEGNYVECRMALFADAACTQQLSVDPRFYAFARDMPGSTGTADAPNIIYRSACNAPMPVGGIYDNNYRVDYSVIDVQQCIWECVGAGYYNCYSTSFGVPVNYNIVVNCCYAPEKLAVRLLSFDGVRSASGVNTLHWVLADTSDLLKGVVERSYDGVIFSAVYSTASPSISNYSEVVDSTMYYRLRVYDKNGSSFYSSVVVLRVPLDLKKSFLVSPSPFVNELHVLVIALHNLRSVFKLISADGKTVMRSILDLKVGANKVVLPVPNVCRGVYILTMSNEEGTVFKKVFKQ